MVKSGEMKVEESQNEIGMTELESYCAWCVGREVAIQLQRAGLTSKICPGHLRKLCEEDGFSFQPEIEEKRNIEEEL